VKVVTSLLCNIKKNQATLMCFNATIVAVEKQQVLHNLSVDL
jgi:hypothetical protein